MGATCLGVCAVPSQTAPLDIKMHSEEHPPSVLSCVHFSPCFEDSHSVMASSLPKQPSKQEGTPPFQAPQTTASCTVNYGCLPLSPPLSLKSQLSKEKIRNSLE